MRPKLLYLVHCYFNRAGTEGHVKALSDGLRDQYDVTIAFPHEDKIVIVKDEKVTQMIPAVEVPWPVSPYSLPAMDRAIGQLFEQVAPDLIHIQHFLRWPLNLIDRAAETGLPLALSFHDYFALTPHYTMEGFSAEQTLTPEYSKAIFQQDISPYLFQRREILQSSFKKVSSFLAPSIYLGREIQKIFPIEINVLELGIPSFVPMPRSNVSPRIRFGFLGSIIPQKGWLPLLQAFEKVAQEYPQAELHFYGGSENMPQINSKIVRFHGTYEAAHLPGILSQIDVGVIPSLFPETYNLVLSEMRLSHLPVAVSDIGALSERVEDGVNGRKFRPGDVADIADKLLWFCKNDSWRSWSIPKPRLVPEMIEDFDSLYQELAL